MAHLRPAEVAQVGEAIDQTWMRQRYHRIDPMDYQGVLSARLSNTSGTGSPEYATSTARPWLRTALSSSPSISNAARPGRRFCRRSARHRHLGQSR